MPPVLLHTTGPPFGEFLFSFKASVSLFPLTRDTDMYFNKLTMVFTATMRCCLADSVIYFTFHKTKLIKYDWPQIHIQILARFLSSQIFSSAHVWKAPRTSMWLMRREDVQSSRRHIPVDTSLCGIWAQVRIYGFVATDRHFLLWFFFSFLS